MFVLLIDGYIFKSTVHLLRSENNALNVNVRFMHVVRPHSGRYGHNNETLILQNFAFIMQFYTYSNPYDMN